MVTKQKEQRQERFRDARTGQYVPKSYAEKHPKTTVKETDRKIKR